MDLTFSHYLQLSIALLLGLSFFVSIYILPQKVAITALIFLIPFQLITSAFGSVNMILTYVIGLTLIFFKQMDRFPLIKITLIIILCYLLTISQVDPSRFPHHFIYLISIISNFLLFYIIYNYIVKSGDYRYFFNLLVILNICFIIYVAYQTTLGFERHAFLGIGEFTTQGSKETIGYATGTVERRLRGGPFEAPGINAEYMVIQILILGYLLVYEGNRYRKILLLSMIIINFMVLIGTGNRGGFFSVIAGAIIFYYLFRKELGIKRIFGSVIIFGFFFAIASLIVINYTPYDSIFQRIKKTEMKGALPDTRQKVWEIAYEAIKQKPILGWGPKMDAMYIPEFKEKNYGRKTKDYSSIPSPHNLYLFLLYSLGIVGLIAYMVYFGIIYIKLIKSNNLNCNDPFLNGLQRLGIVILTVFLIDQIKLEFLRHNLHDYQHYIFMILAAFIAFSDLKKQKSIDPIA